MSVNEEPDLFSTRAREVSSYVLLSTPGGFTDTHLSITGQGEGGGEEGVAREHADLERPLGVHQFHQHRQEHSFVHRDAEFSSGTHKTAIPVSLYKQVNMGKRRFHVDSGYDRYLQVAVLLESRLPQFPQLSVFSWVHTRVEYILFDTHRHWNTQHQTCK